MQKQLHNFTKKIQATTFSNFTSTLPLLVDTNYFIEAGGFFSEIITSNRKFKSAGTVFIDSIFTLQVFTLLNGTTCELYYQQCQEHKCLYEMLLSPIDFVTQYQSITLTIHSYILCLYLRAIKHLIFNNVIDYFNFITFYPTVFYFTLIESCFQYIRHRVYMIIHNANDFKSMCMPQALSISHSKLCLYADDITSLVAFQQF